MGIFGKTKTQARGAQLTKAPPAATGASKPKPPAPPKLSAEDQSRIKDFPQLKKDLKEVKQQLTHQTKELREHEDYLRKTMEGFAESERKRKYQEGEMNEQEAYLRNLMSDFSELTRKYDFQANELQEQEDYLRRLQKGFGELKKRETFQTGELKEQEDFLRKLTEELKKARRQKEFQDNELREQEEHLRMLTRDYAAVKTQQSFQNKELQDQEEHVRRLTRDYSEVQRQKSFQDKEIQEQESHLRQLTKDFSAMEQQKSQQDKTIREHENNLRDLTNDFEEVKRQKSNQDKELREQDDYLRQLSQDYNEVKRQKDAQDREIQEQEIRVRRVLGDLETAQKEQEEIRKKLRKATHELESTTMLISELQAITGQKEQELHEQQLVIDRMTPVMQLNPSGTIRSMNASLANLLGYSPEELIGCNERVTYEFSHQERVRYDNLWGRVTEGMRQEDRLTLFTKNGEPIRARVEYTPITDREGRVKRIIKMVHVAGEEQQVPATLQALQRGVEEFMPTLTFDTQGRIRSANRQMRGLMGWPDQGLPELRFREMIDLRERQSRDFLAMWEFLRSGESMVRPFTFMSYRNETHRLICSLQPVRHSDGPIDTIMLIAQPQEGPSSRFHDPVPELLRYLRQWRMEGQSRFDLERVSDPMLRALVEELDEALNTQMVVHPAPSRPRENPRRELPPPVPIKTTARYTRAGQFSER